MLETHGTLMRAAPQPSSPVSYTPIAIRSFVTIVFVIACVIVVSMRYRCYFAPKITNSTANLGSHCLKFQ